jgi:hypothetical protein
MSEYIDITQDRLEQIHEQQFVVFPEVEKLQKLYPSSKYDQDVLSDILSAQQKSMDLVEEAIVICRHLKKNKP